MLRTAHRRWLDNSKLDIVEEVRAGFAILETVDAATNPRFHALLSEFGRRTGVPVLVNTSFNVRGEPIVCTPKDAIDAFWSTPLDALAIGSFLVEKPR